MIARVGEQMQAMLILNASCKKLFFAFVISLYLYSLIINIVICTNFNFTSFIIVLHLYHEVNMPSRNLMQWM